MTASTASPESTRQPSIGPPSGLLPLARVEALQLVRHPLFVVALLGSAALMLGGVWSRQAYELFNDLTLWTTFFVGPATYFVANLAGSRDRRAHARSWSATLPVGLRRQTAALCLAVLLGPVVAATVATTAGQVVYRVVDVGIARYPSLAEFAIGPVTVLGAGLLGVMVARWAPWPGVAALVMVGLLVVTLALGASASTEWFTPFLELTLYADGRYFAFKPGSAAWHVIYLLCLSGMAAVGALVATPGPRRGLVGIGGVLTVGAAVAGVLQLP